MNHKPVMLLIRDGWGINPGGRKAAKANGDATLLARTPFHDELYKTYPLARLSASGLDVGLPAGQMGNSEVGHMNLGAGRIIYQDLTRINKAIAEGAIARSKINSKKCLPEPAAQGCICWALFPMAASTATSRILVALANGAKAAGVSDIMVHAFTDGRDTSPTGGADFLATLNRDLQASGAKIATVIGRYYPMDRDKRWERNKLAWDAIVLGEGKPCERVTRAAVTQEYAHEKTDEFLQPIIFAEPNEQRIRDGDVVFFFNFRPIVPGSYHWHYLSRFQRIRSRGQPRVHYVTMTEYDETYGVPFAVPGESFTHILGEVVSAAGTETTADCRDGEVSSRYVLL